MKDVRGTGEHYSQCSFFVLEGAISIRWCQAPRTCYRQLLTSISLLIASEASAASEVQHAHKSQKSFLLFFPPDPCVRVRLKYRPYRMKTYRTVPIFTVALPRLKLFDTIFFFDYAKLLLDHFSKLVCKQMSHCAYFQQCLVLQSHCLCSKLRLWLTCIFLTSVSFAD